MAIPPLGFVYHPCLPPSKAHFITGFGTSHAKAKNAKSVILVISTKGRNLSLDPSVAFAMTGVGLPPLRLRACAREDPFPNGAHSTPNGIPRVFRASMEITYGGYSAKRRNLLGPSYRRKPVSIPTLPLDAGLRRHDDAIKGPVEGAAEFHTVQTTVSS